ncbi:MAG: TonB-dependent receptor, partial [Acidimicrobiia bacterium]
MLPAITVTAPRDIEALPTDSASERRISGETLNTRPIERPGEMLEAAPGLIVTQHSGEGKANQYFLRGFNLDHGTDLAIWLDGMPVNMRTHGHGQGYADINFLIPELVNSMLVRKGPYWAQEGDFASAGTLRLDYTHRLERNIVSATGGSYGYWRGLAAGSMPLGNGTLTGAGEVVRYDGPWVVSDATRKYNGVLRYTEGSVENGFSLTAMAYTNSWHSTDQIAQRAWLDGSLDRFGAVDQTDGGDAQRYSLSARWARTGEASAQKIEGYFIYQTLNLYNNFTYFLDNPTDGDQFQQSDKRKIFGLNASHTQATPFLGFDSTSTLGTQFRYDDIAVGLFNTVQRTPTNTIRNDQVSETSLGLWVENKTQWTDWMRSIVGLRGDMYWANVASDTPANSGNMTAFLASPKAGLVFGPFAKSELFVNAGLGFHSNDARGTVITVDPGDRTTSQPPVPVLVRPRGAAVGARTHVLPGLDAAVAFFVLEMDSEILFVGDAGTTEAGRPSRRLGIEWTSHYRP